MKVFQLNKTDIQGGAARASYRLHCALRKHNVDSIMLVDISTSGDWSIQGSKSVYFEIIIKVHLFLVNLICSLLKTENHIIHSLALFKSWRINEINKSSVDIVHLHWVQNEMLSIAEISQINKPIVWTLHDMWAFCGAEHLSWDNRYIDGYIYRPKHEKGFDLNKWTWLRKKKYWKKPIHIVTPSSWLANCAKNSDLMKDWPITVIPNAIDIDRWKPVDKLLARELLSLPLNKKLLLFGAIGGGRDYHKGFDLLLLSLQKLKNKITSVELIIFGQLEPKESVDLGFPVHFVGHLSDDISLNLLYSAADVMLIPSRQDNLPNTGLESMACGIPVVAFDVCGLPDMVKHQYTGYLAKAFDIEDFAEGIKWVLDEDLRYEDLSRNARKFAIESFSYSVVAEKYKALYKEIINKS